MTGTELQLQLFGQVLLGSAVIIAIVQRFKVWWQWMTGWITALFSILVGIALGAAYHFLILAITTFFHSFSGFFGPLIPLPVALAQGFFSGFVASGIYHVLFKR